MGSFSVNDDNIFTKVTIEYVGIRMYVHIYTLRMYVEEMGDILSYDMYGDTFKGVNRIFSKRE